MQAGVYKHYAGGYYQVLGVAEHTETTEVGVVYVSLTGAALSGPRMRFRPFSGPDGFTTDVVLGGVAMPRFTYIGDSIR